MNALTEVPERRAIGLGRGTERMQLPMPTKSRIQRICVQCGQPFETVPSAIKKLCSRACYADWRSAQYRGINHPTYQGRVLLAVGYIGIFEPTHPLAMKHGYVLEHRKMLYDAGILVPEGSHVHHINHVKTDNRLENLQIMTPEEHIGHHTEAGTPIKNQYGASTVATPEEKKERTRINNARKPAGWWRKYARKKSGELPQTFRWPTRFGVNKVGGHGHADLSLKGGDER